MCAMPLTWQSEPATQIWDAQMKPLATSAPKPSLTTAHANTSTIAVSAVETILPAAGAPILKRATTMLKPPLRMEHAFWEARR